MPWNVIHIYLSLPKAIQRSYVYNPNALISIQEATRYKKISSKGSDPISPHIHIHVEKSSHNIQYVSNKTSHGVYILLFLSFDVRGRAFNMALNFSDKNALGPRAYFNTRLQPAALSLEAVQLTDAGIYRCRVDFKKSPTRNFQVNLTVIGKDCLRFFSLFLSL